MGQMGQTVTHCQLRHIDEDDNAKELLKMAYKRYNRPIRLFDF